MRDKLFEKESRIGMFKAKRLLARSIALLVIAALSISVMPVFSLSYNETGDISDEKPVQNEYCEDPDLSGDMDGLRYIDTAEIERQGFIRRLKEKESLNSYAFLNRDGTESVVLFPDNIKYVDESGEIVEKDTAIVGNPSGGFTVKANDYGVLFPENIKDGLQFEYLEGCISMIPDGAGGEYIIEDNSISYLNVFGENTKLRYTPLLNGIKEDIVISGYSGINSFGFDIRSGNLRFSDKATGRVLVNENGEPVIEFGDVIACDSEGKLAAGTLLIEENGENSYHLTVSIPEEFLTDPKTVYPVTIDPTIFESSDGSYIQDSPIFDGASYQNSNFGYYLADYAGLVSSYGNASTAMRLYGLDVNPIYKTLDAEEIVSVKISVKGTTTGNPVYVNLYRISSDVTWDENTVTYNNVGSFDTSVNKGAYLSTTQRTEFDITSFAKGWKNLSYTNTMRVIFTASSGSSTWFYSSHPMNNAGTVDNRPYVIFTYQIKNLMEEGTYYIRNRHIDRFLQPVNGSSSANAGLELNAFSGSDSQKWEVISRGNGYYTIRNVNSEYVLSVPSGSYSTYANKFFNKLVDPDRELTFLKYHHYNKGSNRTASKTDVSVNGSFSNDIDFMVYIGHGLIADSFSGNYLHYNCASNGAHHTSDCSNSQYNAYNTDMEFGSSTSKLRWVWLYTCNFLTTGTYVSDSTLKGMMNGAHIVMGYTSQAYLCDDMAEKFAEYLSAGETIIQSYFKAGHDGEANATSSHHIQKVLYIPQAANETIYSPYVYYAYTSDSVCIATHDIQNDSY